MCKLSLIRSNERKETLAPSLKVGPRSGGGYNSPGACRRPDCPAGVACPLHSWMGTWKASYFQKLRDRESPNGVNPEKFGHEFFAEIRGSPRKIVFGFLPEWRIRIPSSGWHGAAPSGGYETHKSLRLPPRASVSGPCRSNGATTVLSPYGDWGFAPGTGQRYFRL